MTINWNFRALSQIIAIAGLSITLVACSITNRGYELVWADEFNCEHRLSDASWGYENGFVRNEELQWYQEDNAYCKDGMLVIEAKRESFLNPRYENGSDNWKTNREFVEITSASVNTKNKHSWQYGVFEVRAKIKTEYGLWPAIWFLGIEGEWPSNGEIDLMEYYRGMILANAAWADEGRFNAIWDDRKVPVSEFNDPNWDEKFHIWKMEWTEESIKLYLDDVLLNEVDLSTTLNRSDSPIKNPFHQPHYLLLNLAIGGKQGGSVESTQFPSKYLIDYVRVYQKNN